MTEGFIDSSIKFKAGSPDQLTHRGLIKFQWKKPSIPIGWEVFKNLTAEGDIKALTYDINPSDSEEKEQKGGEDEATDDSTGIEEEKDKDTEGGEKEEAEVKQ